MKVKMTVELIDSDGIRMTFELPDAPNADAAERIAALLSSYATSLSSADVATV